MLDTLGLANNIKYPTHASLAPKMYYPQFIIESGFKSRAGYNGARTVYINQFS